MTARGAFVLGLFIVLAALVQGGIYAAGHDFVMAAKVNALAES